MMRAPKRLVLVAVATALLACAVAAVALASTRNARINATWNCCGAGGAALQYWKVTESRSGSLSGTGYSATTVFARISGQVTGRNIRLVTTYNSFAPGYVATFVGKVGRFNLRMSGTWESNRSQSGRWSATRARHPVRIPR